MVVCLSHVGTESKLMITGSCDFHHRVVHRLWFSDANFHMPGHRGGLGKNDEKRQFPIFALHCLANSERYIRLRLPLATDRKSHMGY